MRHTFFKLNTRLLALAMAVLLLVCSVPAVSAAEHEGTCGDDLTWSFSAGTLTISGTGAMRDYPENNMAPWYFLRERIAAVELPVGLTRVGDLAFYGCTALKTVHLPDSVTAIGWHAFDGCTALSILDLGDGLQTIADGAFQNCVSLPAVRLPETLTAIGFQAFYRCESLGRITVPASVTELGMTAFGFCYSLVRAEIQAKIDRLPDWTFYGCAALGTVVLPDSMTGANEYAFYGCTGLNNIVYTGSDKNRARIEKDIQRDLDNTAKSLTFTEAAPENSTSTKVEQWEDHFVITDSTLTATDNATVNTELHTTVTGNGSGSGSSVTNEAVVTITLETAGGWKDVADAVLAGVDSGDKATVNVYIKDSSTLSDDALAALAGKNAVVTVHTAAGPVWRIDCTQLTASGAGFDLSYQRTDATAEQLDKMGCYLGYQITFLSDAQVNAEVMVRLPLENAYKTATLFVDRGGLTRVQTVVVDTQGYAHFYLGSVECTATYLVGIDAPGADTDNTIIPDTMYDKYGLSNMDSGVKYEITGRKSSWNMDITQVTWIMVGALAFVVITVGIVMFMLNKRKLQMGYVPDLEDEGEE